LEVPQLAMRASMHLWFDPYPQRGVPSSDDEWIACDSGLLRIQVCDPAVAVRVVVAGVDDHQTRQWFDGNLVVGT